MARPKKSEARDTRREILDAALDLFAARGFYGTSTRDIARRVGVRESALYHHFASKAAILHALLEELGPGRANMVENLDVVELARALGVEQTFKNLIHMLLTEWANPREMKLMRLMVTEGYRLKSEGIFSPWEQVTKVRGAISGVFKKLIEAGLIRKVDPAAATISFMGPLMMLRLLHLGLTEGKPDLVTLRREVDGHLEFFFRHLALLNERSEKPARRPRAS